MLQSRERIDGVVVRSPLQLEHRPLYNNFAPRTMLTKWRRWGAVHARELTGPFADLPKFNWDGATEWPWWRRPLNLLAPFLFVPYVGASFLNFLRGQLGELPLGEAVRVAFVNTCYAAIVQLYVIREVYGGLFSRGP
jgi:hypothetical protein